MKFDIRGFIKTLTTLFIALKLFKFRKKQTQTSYLKNIRIFFVKKHFWWGLVTPKHFDYQVSMAMVFFKISNDCMILPTKKYFLENFSKILPPCK